MLEKIIAELKKDPENSDLTIEELTEMANYELKAKQNGTEKPGVAYEKHKEKHSTPRKPQVSKEKQLLFNEIWLSLSEYCKEDAEILKENKLIQVKIGEKVFKIDVIEIRTPKK